MSGFQIQQTQNSNAIARNGQPPETSDFAACVRVP